MKFLLLFINLTVAACFYEKKILKEIIGDVVQIEFDSHSNTYVVSRSFDINGDDTFYKLDDLNNVILQKGFPELRSLLIDKKDNVYLFVLNSIEDLNTDEDTLLRLESNEFRTIFKYDHKESHHFFADNSDNVFFNVKSGVALFKPNQTDFHMIRKLIGYSFHSQAEDERGSVYLEISDGYERLLAVVTKKGKRNSVPYANIFPNAGAPSSIAIWRSVIFMVENEKSNTLNMIKNDIGGSYPDLKKKSDLLLFEKDVGYKMLSSTENRFFLLADRKYSVNNRIIYFINDRFDVVKMKDVISPEILKHAPRGYAFGKNGTAFFSYRDSIICLKSEGTNFEKIKVPTNDYIFQLEMDEDDNLYILSNDLYVMRRETNTPVRLAKSSADKSSTFKIKKRTNEIYISALNQFTVLTDS